MLLLCSFCWAVAASFLQIADRGGLDLSLLLISCYRWVFTAFIFSVFFFFYWFMFAFCSTVSALALFLEFVMAS
jgi:hypothetical protein